MSVAAISAPEHPIIVPHFFGGRLELTNGLEVRVLDCEYEASQAAVDDDDDRPPDQVLTRVQLTLVDSANMPVGLPAWCSLLEVLYLLKDEHVIVASCAEEDELRRRRRIALHVIEQRKLAIHHLQLARRRGAKAGLGVTSSLDPKRDDTLGVDDLLRQLAVRTSPSPTP